MAAIALRADYDAAAVRGLAVRCKNPDQARRLLAIAAAYDGRGRAEAAALAGMDRQTLRDWVLRFNEGGAEALLNRPAPGSPRCLSAPQEEIFCRLVDEGPAAAGLEGVARWRCCDLQRVIADRFGVHIHERTVGKLLDRLGFSHITTRPQHYAQDVSAQVHFKKLRSQAGAYSKSLSTGHTHRSLIPRRDAYLAEDPSNTHLGQDWNKTSTSR